jgi:hypothetical protein
MIYEDQIYGFFISTKLMKILIINPVNLDDANRFLMYDKLIIFFKRNNQLPNIENFKLVKNKTVSVPTEGYPELLIIIYFKLITDIFDGRGNINISENQIQEFKNSLKYIILQISGKMENICVSCGCTQM